MLKMLSSSDAPAIAQLLDHRRTADRTVERRVARIVNDVHRGGDRALRRYARQLDGLRGSIEVGPAEIDRAARAVTPSVRRALATAARHIRRVARRQRPQSWQETVAPGVVIEQRVRPLERVGCYVPAGRHPLPSSLLMTAIPARVAGVADVVVACPRPDDTILAAAKAAGVRCVYRMGGAHAIAALGYGTRSIPRVDKIVGPGNAYVTAAKARVAAVCPIDFVAGPTELVILSAHGRPDWIAADLVAQAEHDPEARAILITTSRRLALAVAERATARATASPIARRALARNGAIVICRSMREGADLVNRIAPEHLMVDHASVSDQAWRAGTTFVGPYAAPAAGDYATGSNHVLPTGGAASGRGGLSVSDFVHVSTVQRVSRKGLLGLASTVITLAGAEGLRAHASSVEVRMS